MSDRLLYLLNNKVTKPGTGYLSGSVALRRLLLLCVASFTAAIAYGQGGGYRVSARYATAFRFASADAWNIDFIYSGTKPVNGIIEATIADNKGRKILTMRSEPLTINPGSNLISAFDVSIRTKQYFVAGFAEHENVQGSLPAGTYTICYVAYCSIPDCGGAGQSALYNELPECLQVNVEPPTPLLLAWPEDGAETDLRRPTFTWIPPMPLAQVSGFSYTYSLYQVQNRQTCNEAVLRNPPMYRSTGIGEPTLQYPPELDDLDTGKNYCWKVDGMLSDVQVAQSEVWRLRVRNQSIKKDSNVYVKLTTTDQDIHHIRNNLFFIYDELYSSEKLMVELFDPQGKKIPIDQVFNITYGQNRLELKIDELNLKKGIIYILKVKDQANRTYNLRFQTI
jgi:hypothetical protein